MKKRWLIVLCLMSVLALSCPALAQPQVYQSWELPAKANLSDSTDTYYCKTNGSYALYDLDGHALSAPYDWITRTHKGLYFSVEKGSGANNRGVIDAKGNEIMPCQYGYVSVLSKKWMIGCTLSGGEVVSTDVYYNHRYLTNLGTHVITDSNKYLLFDSADHLAIMAPADQEGGYWLDSRGNLTWYDKDHFSIAEYSSVKGEGIRYNPTQQWAFTPGCTLRDEDVEQHVYYTSEGDFIDLQGNLLGHGKEYGQEYSYALHLGGDYLEVHAAKPNSQLCGLTTLEGREILPPIYAEIAYSLFGGHYTTGYQAALDTAGDLYYFDVNGSVTASAQLGVSSSDEIKGFSYNSPLAAVQQGDEYLIISAVHGVLPTRYEDVSILGAAPIISVKQNGQWGVIDLAGRTVIGFDHGSSLSINEAGTTATGILSGGKAMMYRIYIPPVVLPATPSPTAVPSPTPAPAQENWHCPACGTQNAHNFCLQCGTARPEAPEKAVCSACGYDPEGVAMNFCPLCGNKF